MSENCAHLNARCGGANRIMHAICPDCKAEVPIYEVVNNMLDAMQDSLLRQAAFEQMKKEKR